MALILKFLLMNFYWQIDQFVINLAKKYDQKNKKLLDVGAGECRYRKYFKNLKYKSQDVKQNTNKTIDYVGKPKGKYDYILCTQVLEHVPEPVKIFQEFKRLLKPGGKVFLTTNFVYQLHMEPNDYWRFTEHGLRYLGESAGFKIESLRAEGGIFQVLSYVVTTLPLRMGLEQWKIIYWLYLIIFSPFIMLVNLTAVVFDMFFPNKSLAINYEVIYDVA